MLYPMLCPMLRVSVKDAGSLFMNCFVMNHVISLFQISYVMCICQKGTCQT